MSLLYSTSGPEACGTKKLKTSIIKDKEQLEKLTAAIVCCFPKRENRKVQ